MSRSLHVREEAATLKRTARRLLEEAFVTSGRGPGRPRSVKNNPQAPQPRKRRDRALKGFYPGAVLREVVAYGRGDLAMKDAEIARELCLTRERIRQVRKALGLSRVVRRAPKPPPKRLPGKACAAGCGRTSYAEPVCSFCRNHLWEHMTPERRAYNAEKTSAWRRKALADPKKREGLCKRQAEATKRWREKQARRLEAEP